MGFIPHKYRDGQLDPWEPKPAAAGLTLEVGKLMKLSDGKLAVATATDKPEYICMEYRENQTNDGQMVHVIAVSCETIYETTLSEQSASISVGSTYNIDSTGMMVTATGGGSIRVESYEGKEAGDKVRVTIVPAAV